MKKVIFLIISSHDHPIYSTMREITRIYLNKLKNEYSLEYFFVEFKEMSNEGNNEDNNEDTQLVNDTIYVDGQEMLSRALIKTHKAMNYINKNYEYDIIIRTNISSFWNIPYLYTLIDSFNNTDIATGIVPFDNFISGTGVIISNDVCKKLCNFNLNGEPEDVVLSSFLQQIINIQPLPNNMWCLLEKGINNVIPEDVSNILYFRVKDVCNYQGSREYDGITFKKLAKNLYNIDII